MMKKKIMKKKFFQNQDLFLLVILLLKILLFIILELEIHLLVIELNFIVILILILMLLHQNLLLFVDHVLLLLIQVIFHQDQEDHLVLLVNQLFNLKNQNQINKNMLIQQDQELLFLGMFHLNKNFYLLLLMKFLNHQQVLVLVQVQEKENLH